MQQALRAAAAQGQPAAGADGADDAARSHRAVHDRARSSQYKLGRKGIDDGVLMVVAKDDHRVRIEPGYGLEGAIPDAIANRIIQRIPGAEVPRRRLRRRLADATGALAKLVDGEPLPAPMADNQAGGEDGGGWLFALLAASSSAQVGAFDLRRRAVAAARRGRRRGRRRRRLADLVAAAGRRAGRGDRLLPRPGPAVRGRLRAWRWIRRLRRLAVRRRRFGGRFGGGGGGWSGGGGMSGGGGASGSW